MSKTSEPAFPSLQTFQKFDDHAGVYVDHMLPAGGLTKREYFAAMAMQAIAADCWSTNPLACADLAVKHADALLFELEKS